MVHSTEREKMCLQVFSSFKLFCGTLLSWKYVSVKYLRGVIFFLLKICPFEFDKVGDAFSHFYIIMR